MTATSMNVGEVREHLPPDQTYQGSTRAKLSFTLEGKWEDFQGWALGLPLWLPS